MWNKILTFGFKEGNFYSQKAYLSTYSEKKGSYEI